MPTNNLHGDKKVTRYRHAGISTTTAEGTSIIVLLQEKQSENRSDC